MVQNSFNAGRAAVGPPPDVSLGPLLKQLLSGAKWRGTDAFPAWQDFADEFERILGFLQREGRLEKFLTAIQGVRTPQHRQACLAEAIGAFYLREIGFRIVEWEPTGEGATKGELLVALPNSPNVFVEIKAPGWQGECLPRRFAERRGLSAEDQERCFARIEQEKHLNGEGGAIGSHMVAMDVVRRRALPKFRDGQSNLAIVVDDLRMTPVGLPGLAQFVEREFANPDRDPDDPNDLYTYERLGGLLFIYQQADLGKAIWYRADFVENTGVTASCALPTSIVALLSRMREESRRKRELQFVGRSSIFDIIRRQRV